jgi:hypothetical protein
MIERTKSLFELATDTKVLLKKKIYIYIKREREREISVYTEYTIVGRWKVRNVGPMSEASTDRLVGLRRADASKSFAPTLTATFGLKRAVYIVEGPFAVAAGGDGVIAGSAELLFSLPLSLSLSLSLSPSQAGGLLLLPVRDLSQPLRCSFSFIYAHDLANVLSAERSPEEVSICTRRGENKARVPSNVK